ncbi:MAG: hypothetical protein QM488_16515 [Rhizobiaceae bacterium]
MIRKRLKPFALATIAASCAAIPSTALAYCMDHSILLCMAGGFPPGAVCNKALAVVIRRVTPFPYEPPLQLWRCPFGALAPAPYKQSIPQPINAVFAQSARATEANIPQAARLWLAQETGDDFLAFTRELRVIYGSGFHQPANERHTESWHTTIQVCDNESKNCRVSQYGTGLGSGENGNVGIPAFPGVAYTHHSDLFDKSISINRTTGRAVALLYWDFKGNPTLTEWIKY